MSSNREVVRLSSACSRAEEPRPAEQNSPRLWVTIPTGAVLFLLLSSVMCAYTGPLRICSLTVFPTSKKITNAHLCSLGHNKLNKHRLGSFKNEVVR